jgi:hypothetical protein
MSHLTWTADEELAAFDIFIKHYWTPCTILVQNTSSLLDCSYQARINALIGGILGYVYMLQHAITTYQEFCETEFKLVLQQLTLTCCGVHG